MQCEVCGNSYKRSFEVTMGTETFVFDCFECAVHRLAPECEHCGCKVIGHGVESGTSLYCCNHCLRAAGAREDPGADDDEDDEDSDEEGDDDEEEDAPRVR